jgi:hypothetical chaperone protein
MPSYIYEELCEWQTLILLNRPDILKFLSEAEHTADHPEQIRSLTSLISNNYGLLMFDEVERAKIELSSLDRTAIRLDAKGLRIEEPLRRQGFEHAIQREAAEIAACVDDTLAAAGLRPGQIDAVLRTGGSSLIPLFQRMLEDRFSPDRVKAVDEFTGVTAGLAIAAHELAQGRLQLPSYSREILTSGQLVADREPLENGHAEQQR